MDIENKEEITQELVAPAVVAKVSEQEQIKYLRSRSTNYVFLFGKHDSGKTAITASLIHYLNTQCHYGGLEKNGNPEGQRLWEVIKRDIGRGRFPDRTGEGRVFEVESTFVPSGNRKHLSKLPLTFLDMSGESLSQVSVTKSGKFPSNIDIYFKAGLSIVFLLVTSHAEASEDDHLMDNFLDYINQKSPRFRDARVLLLVSKWDKYAGLDDVTEFLRYNMPRTFKRLSRSTNAYGNFSLGTVEDNVDDSPFIQEYNGQPAKIVFEWIYHTLTGRRVG